jgi:thiamine-phosphate pyrophosphorylase
MIERLQLITMKSPQLSHIEQVELACKGGAKWIQLRVKEQSYEEWLDIARASADIVRQYQGVRLIINDSVQIAMEVDADGVHLGKDDMPIRSARMLLGGEKIIGGTANTLADAIFVRDAGADYVGLGPYSDTTTKTNLSEILGIQGYRSIIQGLRDKEIDIPVIAIGGIRGKDVRPLMVAGLYGVAVASAVYTSAHPLMSLHELQKAVSSSYETTDYAGAHHS